MAFDAQGTVYVCDSENSRVVRVSPEGRMNREFGRGILKSPVSLAIDSNIDILYIADDEINEVVVFETSGEFVGVLGGKGRFQYPVGVVVDSKGNVLVYDNGDNCVYVY